MMICYFKSKWSLEDRIDEKRKKSRTATTSLLASSSSILPSAMYTNL